MSNAIPVEVTLAVESDTMRVGMTVQSNNEEYMLGSNETIGAGGTRDYNKLLHRPSIEGHVLEGESSLEDISVYSLSNIEIEKLLK